MEQIKPLRIRHFAQGGAAFCLFLCAFALLYLNKVSIPASISICAAAAIIISIAALFLHRNGLSIGCILAVIYLISFALFSFEPILELNGEKGTFTLRAEGRDEAHTTYGMVECTLLEHNGKKVSSPSVRLILTDGSPQTIVPGDKLTINGKLSITQGVNGFRQGAFLTLKQGKDTDIIIESNTAASATTCLARFSLALSDKIHSLMPNDEGALLSALICGDKSGFTPEYNASLRASGLSHIAAVSGMHLSILLAIICLIFPKKAALIISLPVMLGFAAMTGFSPSIVRALIMSSLLALAFLLRAEYDAITALTVAGAVIGFLNPFALCSASFLLSFFSTLGIVLFSPRIMGFFSERLPKNKILHKICHLLISALSVTAAATIFTLPLQLFFFPSVSLISLFSNLLATWAVAPAMFMGIFLLPVAIFIPFLEGVAVFIMSLPLKYINQVIFLTGDTLRTTANSDDIWIILTTVILFSGALSLYFRKISPALFGSVAATTIILSACFSLFAPPQISVWGEGGNVCISVTKGSQVVNIGAPSHYNGAYFAESQLGKGRNQTLLLTDTSYSASGSMNVMLCDKIYSPKEIQGATTLVYTQNGRLDFDGFSAELILPQNSPPAIRIVTDKLSLLNLSAIDAYTELPDLPKADIIVLDAEYTNVPRMFESLCARLMPSVILLSGNSDLSPRELYELCGCKIIFLDSAGVTKIK